MAIAWGPLAGYYASRSPIPLEVTPIATPDARRGIPFSYAIAVGVRKGDTARRALLQRELDRRRGSIAAILRSYHVPLVAGNAREAAPDRAAMSSTRSDSRRVPPLTEDPCGLP